MPALEASPNHMSRCAFLTTDDLTGYTTDDELASRVLHQRGWSVEEIPWRRYAVDWKGFDIVVIRSTWDYHRDLESFLSVLERVAAASRLVNPLELVRRNVRKTYLRDLAAVGIATVPTWWRRGLDPDELKRSIAEWGVSEIVVKPVVSASAGDTFRIRRDEAEETGRSIEDLFRGRDVMLQPFVETIVEEGEYSLFYFEGGYSHAVLKTPKERDFRVQEEHGASIIACEPTDTMRDSAADVMQRIDPVPLYARVDLVRVGDRFALMELELVEPALYFRTALGSAERFADAIERRMNS